MVDLSLDLEYIDIGIENMKDLERQRCGDLRRRRKAAKCEILIGVVGELERNRLLEIWNRGSHRTSKTDDGTLFKKY
uniref:Uncharacterized protein n=1 Tax=Cucumis sativus TaxID=3659 RepID=A0A0A0L7Z8_CUCSA